MTPFVAGLPNPPDPDEESFRKALCRNDVPLGEVDAGGDGFSFFSSSLSLGEYAAPNGLGMSIFGPAEDDFKFIGLPLELDGEGGVVPEENFELKDEIQEFLLPVICLGALRGIPEDDADEVGSNALSSLFAFGSGRGSSRLGVCLRFDSDGGAGAVFSDGDCRGMLLSGPEPGWSQVDDGADLQRER